MIPPPVEEHARVPVDFERSSGPWALPEFRLTYVQLLSLCAALFFFLLLHVVRSSRLSRAGISSTSSSCGLVVGDKGLYEHKEEDQLSEKSSPQSSSASTPGKGWWWWVDALLGRDTEEDEAVANAARSMVVQTHHQLVWPVQNDPGAREYRDSILYYQPRQRPPISMAKLIMLRHAHPPRRPRSPPKPTLTTATTTQPHPQPSSRLSSPCV